MPLTVEVQQVGIEKRVVRKCLLSGNPLLVMYPFEGVGVVSIGSTWGNISVNNRETDMNESARHPLIQW